jgi:hypothetical protein
LIEETDTALVIATQKIALDDGLFLTFSAVLPRLPELPEYGKLAGFMMVDDARQKGRLRKNTPLRLEVNGRSYTYRGDDRVKTDRKRSQPGEIFSVN